MQYVNQSIPDWFMNIAKPFVSMLYIVSGNAKLDILSSQLYSIDEYVSSVSLSHVDNADVTDYTIDDDRILSDSLIIVGNYVSQDMVVISANDPEHDLLTDLLYSSFKSLLLTDVSTALSTFGAFMLLGRMINDRFPALYPEIKDIEVTPYELY